MDIIELVDQFMKAQKSKDYNEMATVAARAIQDLSATEQNKGYRYINVLPDGQHYGIEHFGICPKCFKQDGYLNVGPNHFIVCDKCKTYWYVGSNLFSSWHDETKADWRQNQKIIKSFTKVEPAISFEGHEYCGASVNKTESIESDDFPF